MPQSTEQVDDFEEASTEMCLADGMSGIVMKSCDYLDPPLTKWEATDDMAGNVLGTEKYQQEERTEMAVGNYVRSHGDLPLGGFEFSASTNFYGMAPSVFDAMKFAYLKVLEECFNFETGPPINISFGVVDSVMTIKVAGRMATTTTLLDMKVLSPTSTVLDLGDIDFGVSQNFAELESRVQYTRTTAPRITPSRMPKFLPQPVISPFRVDPGHEQLS